MSPHHATVRIGSDVGGTFTDVILTDPRGGLWVHKVPSTPPDFERAVLDAVEHLLRSAGVAGADVAEVTHATTVATNAVLEHRGARTALVTTRGFRDVLELRRIRAPQMYDLFFDKPAPLVERRLRYELGERVSAAGEVLAPIDQRELEDLARRLREEQVESVAVCLLHAYGFPAHEAAVGAFLRERLPGVPVSLSHEVLPERKEYERTATTVVNAYVRPLMGRYLEALHGGLRQQAVAALLLIMQSAGGLAPEDEAAVRPVYALESGPAAGVLAAGFCAGRLGLKNVVTLDVGGTTAKASLIEDGRVAYSPEYEVGATLSVGHRLVGGRGETVRAPSIDIAEVGAGGGSIAYLDRAGGVHVGPRSAGAVPGPACYGRGGTQPTLTDANVVLGYVRTGPLAGGEVRVDAEAARRAVHDHVARPLGMSLLEAALGIHRIANARMMRALRAVSTQRGRDPRDFALLAFGGSGPVHAAGLARDLGIGRVLVPPLPGLFSALGLLFSGVEHHDVRSCSLWGAGLTADALGRIRTDMRARMLARLAAEGFAADQVRLEWGADVRYRGQAAEVRVALDDGPATDETLRRMRAAFEDEHERLYGHRADPDNPVEVVAARLVGREAARGSWDVIRPVSRYEPADHSRRAYFGDAGNAVEVPVLARHAITDLRDGPLLIDEYDSTTVVPPSWRVRRDEGGNLVLEPADG